MRILDAVVLLAVVAGAVAASLRWLRVAQREHYLVGEGRRFSWRWWTSGPDNVALGSAGLLAAIGSAGFAPAALVSAGVTALAPLRLPLRGRTGRLAWTRRLTTMAIVAFLLEGVATAVGALAGGLQGAIVSTALIAMLTPAVVDTALLLTRPFEELSARRYVRRAEERLKEVGPLVIGITGSYGKTTAKGYIAQLVGACLTTLPSPKSFNNRAGLARTVNELLEPGTEVLIAEMGTYGPGEISELCSWLRPEIAVITAIGPAHLERFRSLGTTLAAKAEIAETARVVVLNADDERLAGLADVLRAAGKKVITASGASQAADVAVLPVDGGLELRVEGHRLGMACVVAADQPTALSNAACAVGVAIELGISKEDILAQLSSLPVPPNRLQRYMADGGYVVFDDTFNSNPTGARLGLERLRQEASVTTSGRRVVVTPGMVELGRVQDSENADLGEAAARIADVLVIVARTNRLALITGARRAATAAEVIAVDRLDQAVEWVRMNLGPGDAVLYENDLPDHFP
ncbi:MAG: Mur ligase family protein [Acidimicrobiales bacterium]